MKKPLVGILMGSESDLPIMEKAAEVLKEMGVSCEMDISSAHRLPEKTTRYARMARERGIHVLIAGAGMAAHLAGVLASHNLVLGRNSPSIEPIGHCDVEAEWIAAPCASGSRK